MPTEQLTQEGATVDVRSKFEFETLHIKNTLTILLTALDFWDKVGKLAKKSSKPNVMSLCFLLAKSGFHLTKESPG